MNCKSHILLLLSCLIGILSFGQNIQFIENKGQWDPQVKFMGQVTNGAFFIHQNGFTVLQYKPEDVETLTTIAHGKMKDGKLVVADKNFTLHSHAYRVEFVNGSAKSIILPEKAVQSYNNYFIGSDPSKWATGCKIYQAITVKEVYPGVDVRYYTDKGSLKYDLIVHPGGDLSAIAMKYQGPDGIEIKNKELVIATSVGVLKESAPYSFQYNEKTGKAETEVKYSLKDNVVRFNVRKYDPSSTLVIDPQLIFCSFTGSFAENWGFTATYGPDGSMYAGGIAKNAGFPISTGAFQQQNGGGDWDIAIIKLSADGSTLMYGTYIGGSGIEQPHSLIVDPQGELVVAGRSNSPNYPTKGPHANSYSGAKYDIVVSKLNVAGTALIGSMKIGGGEDDGANIRTDHGGGPQSLVQNYGDDGRSEVNLDAAGNIYVASCTKSTDFPTKNPFQTSNKGGQDGVVLKLLPDVSDLVASSYLGGGGNDAGYVISVNPVTGLIYVGGGTESGDFLGNTSSTGTVGPISNGGIDGFVAVISNNGASLIRSAYIGTTGIDQVYGVQFDALGFPYIMGQTTGVWQASPGVWSMPGGKQFIAKLQPDLSAFVYKTMFGTGDPAPNISPVAFLVDRCENVYISGWGGNAGFPNAGVVGLPVTPDAFKSSPDPSGGDFYFFVLKRNATGQLFGSFFGETNSQDFPDHVDGGTSRFDRNGVIYQAICANCGHHGFFPTTAGAYSTSNNGPDCNMAMVKIDFDLSGVRSGVQSWIGGVPRDTSGCVPLTVEFRDTVQNAVRYEWDFGDASGTTFTTQPVTTHQYLTAGTFRVRLIAIDSTTCNIRDTSYVNIKVSDLISTLDFNPVKLNPCDSFKYRFDNTSIAPPTRPFVANSFKWDFGDGTSTVVAGSAPVFHTYTSPGTYNVKLILVDTAYCNYPDTLIKTIRVAALVKADFTVPNGCAPYNAVFSNTSAAGSRFIWDFGDASGPSNAVNPTHLYTMPGTYTITLIAIDSATCNIVDTTTGSITVFDKPTAGFTASPQPPVTNTSITFTNLSSPDAVRFKWTFGDGDSLITTSRTAVQHEYNKTAVYNACLIAFNAAGCPDTICQQVRTLIEPAVDVPNAFTPGKNGVNGVVYVRGFGIAKMKFTVWARWGEKVFETNSKNIGWDGTYQGKLLPQDVYAYTLDVEFTDGTHATKKGDITLIR